MCFFKRQEDKKPNVIIVSFFVENHKHCKAISYFVKTTTKCTNFSSAKPRVTICQSRWLVLPQRAHNWFQVRGEESNRWEKRSKLFRIVKFVCCAERETWVNWWILRILTYRAAERGRGLMWRPSLWQLQHHLSCSGNLWPPSGTLGFPALISFFFVWSLIFS